MKCPNCGKVIDNDSEFCYFCGTELTHKMGDQTPYDSEVKHEDDAHLINSVPEITKDSFPSEGAYRISGLKGSGTLYASLFLLCTVAILLPTAIEAYFGNNIMDMLPSVVGGIMIGFLALPVGLFLHYGRNKTYIQLDKNGIKGKGLKGGRILFSWIVKYEEFSYKWENIKNLKFSINNLTIITDEGKNTFSYPFSFKRNTEFLSAVHTFGGDRILSEEDLYTIKKRRKILPIFCLLLLSFIIIMPLYRQSKEPFYYTVHDVAFVGDDIYAVGSMCKGTSKTDRPVLWKNNVIKELGPIGNFNYASHVAILGEDLFVCCDVNSQKTIYRNTEKFFILHNDIEIQSMCVSKDLLYILGYNTNLVSENSMIYDTTYTIWQYTKGEKSIKRTTQKKVPDMIWNELMSNKIIDTREFYQLVKGKEIIGDEHDFYYAKISGKDIYILGHGKTDTRSKDGAIVDIPIWRYIDQGDTYTLERYK